MWFLLVVVVLVVSFFIFDNITQEAYAYGGGKEPDPRICGDKMCSEIPGGREAWEAGNNVSSLVKEDKESRYISESKELSPRKQMASGIAAKDVMCDVGLTLMQKLASGDAACVKPSSAIRLEEMGWGTIIIQTPVIPTEIEQMLEERLAIEQKQTTQEEEEKEEEKQQ